VIARGDINTLNVVETLKNRTIQTFFDLLTQDLRSQILEFLRKENLI